jgi:spore coat protein U-like protein
MQITTANQIALLSSLPAIALLLFAPATHAANSTLSVSATVLAKNGCSFSTPASFMNFGTLAQVPGVDGIVAAPLTIRCIGNKAVTNMKIIRDAGQNAAASASRMKHATNTIFLPYSISYAGAAWNPGASLSFPLPSSTDYTFALDGKVLSADIMNAELGAYSDVVLMTITP